VVAVVVAYNRRDLLLEALDALEAQTLAPAAIVVVDNASTDGSGDAVAAAHPHVDLVRLERNTGGAGGFAVGLARALCDHPADWVWLMDDDTIPTPSALAELVAGAAGDDAVVLAGSRVEWTDGSEHPMNTPRRKPFVRAAERRAAESRGVLAVRSSSFVSMLVRADAVAEHGLPVADYFIWNDDFEFSTRLLRGRRGVFVPRSVVVHKTKVLGATDLDPGPRFYYEVRNKLWMLRRSRSLAPAEKVLYFGSTLRRWLRTFARSGDRAVLRDGLRRGLRDGLRTGPRSNTDVLDGLGSATESVARAERGNVAAAGGGERRRGGARDGSAR